MAETNKIMTRDEKLKEIEDRYEKKFAELEDRFDKLKAHYEKRDEIAKLDQTSTPNVKVFQNRPLGPVDHQSNLVKKHADKLKGKAFRFVNTHESVMSLRAAQGYEKVKDEKSNEVRYMDGVLMAMPERQYEETVKSVTTDRRARHQGAILNSFHEQGKEFGIQTYGRGIDYDGEA